MYEAHRNAMALWEPSLLDVYIYDALNGPYVTSDSRQETTLVLHFVVDHKGGGRKMISLSLNDP